MAKAIICQLGCPAVSGFEGQFSRPVARAQLAMRRSAGTSVRARGSSVDPPDLRQLAKMAHIGITEQEIEDWTPKISSIVDWFGELSEADVSSVQPSLRGISGEDATREDFPVVFAQREEMLSMAPEIEGPYLKVPKITTEADA